MTKLSKKQKERGLLFERWPLITACWSIEAFAHAEESSSPQHVGHLVGELGHHADVLEADADEMVDRHRDDRAENQDAEVHEGLRRLHCTTSSRYWITTKPSWRGYRICRVSTMIPMPLRIAYYGLYVKANKKSAFLLFLVLNLMNSMIKIFGII